MNTSSDSRSDSSKPSTITIVYDGECPFCQNYVNFIKLRERFGEVQLIDARSNPDLVEELTHLSINLDEGMAVLIDNQWHHGADAMHQISLVNDDDSLLKKIHNYLFSSTSISGVLYPILRFFRNLTLRLLNRKKINEQ